MSLVNSCEILPPKHDKLGSYLYNELKNQCAWRDNKSDSIQDQYRFFDSYFGKTFKNNYINKDLIYDYLKESEKAHYLQLNTKILNKSKFLEIDQVTNNEEDFYLYYHDNDDKKFNLINFRYDHTNKQISFNDLEDFLFTTDTNLRQLMVPQSDYFKPQIECVNRCLLMDMYSIYSLDFEKMNDEIKLNKFDKLITLEEIPNSYMSSCLIDKFFVVSYSNSSNYNNRITLIDDNFRISAYKDFKATYSPRNDNKIRPYKKGEFLKHPMIVLLYKEIGDLIISDFRVINSFYNCFSQRKLSIGKF